ncbi:pentapeptide repeat-containing protein [Streptomyces sp. NPDC057217]|uniref:pentapeptide repeat-containing protein n=1 Tax=Streptomyces sp. NPDC057217 TaxID=3346054 RepID=UPI00363B121C
MSHSSPSPSIIPPDWQYCGHGSAPGDPVGCRGIHVPGYTACLAHLADPDRDDYLSGLAAGADIDHRGTPFTGTLLDALLASLRDPTTRRPHLGDASFESATFEGGASFASATFEGDALFEAATFTGRASFRSAAFTDALFASATFAAEAWFGSATFTGAAWFVAATFTGEDAWFESATFTGVASFESAAFAGSASFESGTFEGDALFEAASFTGRASFGGATFTGNAWFESTTFTDDATFPSATFESDAWFESATFSGDAWFESAAFTGSARFMSTTFTGVASFEAATFTGKALFVKATFASKALFVSASFSGEASFVKATFESAAWFVSGTFTGAAFFVKTTFAGDAFISATFEGDAAFRAATFGGDAWFLEAVFERDANFASAVFERDAGFEAATFQRDARFESATFERASTLGPLVCAGQVQLSRAVFAGPVTLLLSARRLECRRTRWSATAELRLRYVTVDFAHAVFEYPLTIAAEASPFALMNGEPMAEQAFTDTPDATVRIASLRGVDAAHLVLADVDLARCLFTGTVHLDQLKLEGACSFDTVPSRTAWQRWRPVRFTKRRALAEEHHWRATQPRAIPGWNVAVFNAGQVGPAQLAPVYRALRKSYEDSKNEPGAADFYYGEMEMRRRDRDRASTNRAERGLLTGYWLLSGYGLRASRALGWLAAAMLVTIVLLMGFGLPKEDPKQEGTGTVPAGGGTVTFEIDKADPQNPTDRFSSERFEKALNVTLNSVVFRSSGQDLTTAGTYIEMASRVTEPILLGLAILAVRNRVKR